MATEKQIQRWAFDWNIVKTVAGRKVDSIQFYGEPPKERLLVRFQDGFRLVVQANPDGTLRAWLSCCGKSDGDPAEVK